MTEITFTVAAKIRKSDLLGHEVEELEKELLKEWASVKSGLYENLIWGVITEVKVTKKK